ncbi:glycosyltransferase [Pelagibacteraceae bacterium]|jgi:GT2 family glycosyltransferase|nr:glycosyltransferase [Pelagibacteraceae bacterium]
MFSIIIPTLNNFKYLKLCIDSIKKNSEINNEIIVHVSEDKNNQTRNFLTNQNIKFTFTESNVGLCTAINTVAKEASNKYLIYAHDDMYFCPGWEKPLINEINSIKHNYFYISGTMIEPNSGHIKFNCGENIENFDEKKLLDNLHNLNIEDHQGSHFAPHCVHKEIWDMVGGFSEEFNPGIGSDPDFNMKLWNIGVRIFKGLNSFKVYHFGSLTTRKNKQVIQNKGDNTFLKKWGISTSFFKYFYLRSKSIYRSPLNEPNKNILYFLGLLKCKLKLTYLNFFNIND